jgi:hypothetical protein
MNLLVILTNLVSKTIKSFIYMGCGVNKLIFGITGTEEPINFPVITNNPTYLLIAHLQLVYEQFQTFLLYKVVVYYFSMLPW